MFELLKKLGGIPGPGGIESLGGIGPIGPGDGPVLCPMPLTPPGL